MEFVVIVVEDYDVMVVGFNVVMVIGFYCCYGCCVCCGVFSFEFFVDNKYCYDMVFNVVLKFVDFVLYCNLKKLCLWVIFLFLVGRYLYFL